MKRTTIALAAFLCSFGIYISNGQTMGSYDSAPNSILVFNMLERHALDLDPFRNSYFVSLGGQYAFVEAPNGHLTSVFPIGTAILAAPIYAAIYATGAPAPITSAGFEPVRRSYEKFVAALLAALSVAVCFLCARILGNTTQAAIATAVYAVGTSMWTIGSQALWQHGPVNLTVLAMVYCLLRVERAGSARAPLGWLLACGFFAGFLPVIRPTAVFFSAAGIAFAFWMLRARAWPLLLAFVVGLSPAVVWNAYFFHTLVGGYVGNTQAFTHAPSEVLAAFAGLLLSPSRGLLVFSPVFAFSLIGVVAATRSREPSSILILLLSVAAAALVAMYSFFEYWWGGYAYGPRFLTDVAAVGSLLLVYIIPLEPVRWVQATAANRLAAGAFAALFIYSVGTQFVGANSGAAGADWNAVPLSVDRVPSRLWQIADNQIERNARATYYKDVAWNLTLAPDYYRGLNAQITAVSAPRSGRAGNLIEASATVRNSGRSRLYGYDSGVYLGQMRIRVRVFDRSNRLRSEQYLFLHGTAGTGEEAQAIGAWILPGSPGLYRLEMRPLALGLDGSAGFGRPVNRLLQVTT